MEPQDEFVHEYPKDLDTPWKENWYFNFIDRENKAWGINHFSLERHKSRARFSAFHIIDDEISLYSNLVDIDENFKELDDGKLKAEFLQPMKKFRLSFDGPKHKLAIDYNARFEVFDYTGGKPPKKGQKEMSSSHYEQALWAEGTIEVGGKTRKIKGYGHRDHTWGYRNEKKISGWNWIAVQFENRTINMSLVTVGQAFMGSGFISEPDGNTRIIRVQVNNTRYDDSGKIPQGSEFIGTDKNGKAWKLRSEKFSGLVLPMQEKGAGVVVYENFADFTLEDTGEKGVGIDEYLVNPLM